MAKMSCLGFLLVAVVFGFAESHFFPPSHGPFGPHGLHRPMLPVGMPVFPPMVFRGPVIKKPVPVLQKVPVMNPVPFVKRVPVIQNVPVLRPYPVFRQIVVPRPVMVPVVREVQVPKPVPRPVPVPYPVPFQVQDQGVPFQVQDQGVPFQVQDQGVRIAQGPGAVSGVARTADIIVSDADHVNMATSVIMDSQASNIVISDADHVTLDNQAAGSSVSFGSHSAGGANMANTGNINTAFDLSGLSGNNFVNGPGAGPSFNFAGGNTIVQGQGGQQNGAFVGSPLAVISFDASNGLPDGAFSANFVDFGIGHGNNGGVGIDLAEHNIGGSQGGIGIELNGGGQQGGGGGHNGVSVELAGHNIAGGHGGNGVNAAQIDIGHGVGNKAGGNTVVDIHVGGGNPNSRNNHANQVVPV